MWAWSAEVVFVHRLGADWWAADVFGKRISNAYDAVLAARGLIRLSLCFCATFLVCGFPPSFISLGA